MRPSSIGTRVFAKWVSIFPKWTRMIGAVDPFHVVGRNRRTETMERDGWIGYPSLKLAREAGVA